MRLYAAASSQAGPTTPAWLIDWALSFHFLVIHFYIYISVIEYIEVPEIELLIDQEYYE